MSDEVPVWVKGVRFVLSIAFLVGFGFVSGIVFSVEHPLGRRVARNLTNPNVTTGDTCCRSILYAFDTVIGILGVVAFLGLVFAAFTRSSTRRDP